MIKIIKGDIFETPADIRVNTVNCVGVMGAGVALAFKNRYPEMFGEYQKDCKAGKVKPGKLHIWKSLFGDWIINFPTKRHWRELSRYEDIEAGLIALHEYLLKQTKEHPNLRVALPALGCGHGGLDWNRISEMIREHLSDLEAEITVFEPSASRNAGQKIQNGVDKKSIEKLQSLGVAVIGPGHERYPEALRGKSAAMFYAKGNMNILRRHVLALLPSTKPSKREVNAATACIEAIARPGVTLLVGYGPAIERPSIRVALEKGADVALLFSEGIINFRIRRDLQDIWDENRVLVFSAAKPNQRWSPSLAFRTKNLQLTMAKAALITDPSPDWLSKLLKKQAPSQLPTVFYVNYDTADSSTKSIFGDIRAFPIGRSVESGKPNVAPIIECLGITKTPDSEDTEASIVDAYVPNAQVVEQTSQIHEAPAKQTFPEKQRVLDGIPRYPKRLIEVELPIKRISAHARREKSIRHGHISTLHIWWARRPLAACRAVICAALWPDPADELCPQGFRDAATKIIMTFARKAATDKSLAKTCDPEIWAKWNALSKHHDELDPTNPSHLNVLRFALLDFIADFANWANSTKKEYLETSRALTQAAHEALGGAPGTKPLVVDPFAGGGAIPLEALRVGADTFASDLNPVAVLLNKVALEYIPKYGQQLADGVRKWGQWIKQKAEKELAEFYPSCNLSINSYTPKPEPVKRKDGVHWTLKGIEQETPIAYLWARTIQCEGPGCGAEVPLMRSLWLAKKSSHSVALKLLPVSDEKRVDFEIIDNAKAREVGEGTVKRGSATCPCCGFTTPVASVRKQLKARKGGAHDARLFAVVSTLQTTRQVAGTGRIELFAEKGRYYRLPTALDLQALSQANEELERRKREHRELLSLVPNEPTTGYHTFVNRGSIYGMTTWEDYFTPRQALSLSTLARLVREAGKELASIDEKSLATAVQTCLALAVDKQADSNSSLCSWRSTSQDIGHTFGRQALPMVWDFVEGNVLSGATRDWLNAIAGGLKALESLDDEIYGGQAEAASATTHPLPDDTAHAFVTDPPYYYSVQYADLSDFFYVWLRRTVGNRHAELFNTPLTPKDDEIIVQSPGHEFAAEGKNNVFYESRMEISMAEGRRILAPSGIGVVVFAHTSTAGWEALLQALIDAGWTITGSWPIDTEMASRVLAQNRSVLASSVHIVCRPRENPDGSLRTDDIGDWRDVLQELPKRIHSWMPRLAREGVVGADAIFACLGPALEIFSRYSMVEKASGEQVPLKEYLEHVWAAVAKEALNMIFEGADATDFEEDARLTAMWLWTISTGGNGNGGRNGEGEARASIGYMLEYDAARKIAQGLGAHLERLANLVEIKGNKARLLPVSERTQHFFGKESAQSPKGKRKKKDPQMKLGFMAALEEAEEQSGWDEKSVPSGGKTVLDRLHQCMILFAAGRGEALKRFLVEEGVGRDQRFWRLAQAFSALYPAGVDEKRWVDGVLAKKKGLGF